MRFLRLQFIDVMGVLKNVEVPQSQFEKALEGDIMFDGSSIEGFVRGGGIGHGAGDRITRRSWCSRGVMRTTAWPV